MGFDQEIHRHTRDVDAVIMKYIPAEEGLQETIFKAMNYSLLAGGKRIRPMLMQETYRFFGKEDRLIEPFMAAIEMIHTSSLVHDDLPCMDNDEYRRGRKTTWKVYGEDMATLAGDALMIYAFEVAAKAFSGEGDSGKVGRCIGILAKKTGIYGMIGGQTVDIESTGKEIPKDTLNFIYQLKTAALLEASMMIGALLGGADEDELAVIGSVANAVGLAFQIQDDILDVTSSVEVLGKPILSDEKNKKTTYVSLEGIESAAEEVLVLSDRAIESLNGLSGENPFLIMLINQLITREK